MKLEYFTVAGNYIVVMWIVKISHEVGWKTRKDCGLLYSEIFLRTNIIIFIYVNVYKWFDFFIIIKGIDIMLYT